MKHLVIYKKRMGLAFTVIAIGAVGYLGSTAYSSASTTEVTGKVQKFVLNPEGDVDGFLLDKGPQIHFPPHMSKQLLAVVSANDEVKIKGHEESSKVFKAETIENLATKKSVVESAPQPPKDRPEPPPGPGGSIAGPGGPDGMLPPPPPGHGPREGLSQLTAEGKIANQLFGRRNEVNGVILANGTIIRFGPRLASDSKAKFDVGQNLRVTGFGTKNAIGESIEAAEVSN